MGLVREYAAYNARFRKLVKTIVEGDLVNAVNASPVDIALGFLPGGSLIPCAPTLALATQFTGGGATTVTLTLGTAAAPTLIATAFDIFGATASGLPVDMARGAQRVVPAAGQTIIARITPDAGHNLTALTAGSLSLELYFVLPGIGDR